MKIEGCDRVSDILSMMPKWEPVKGGFSFPLKEINPVVLQEKCELGEAVHKAIEEDFRSGFFPLTGLEKQYFESFKKWKIEMNPSWVDGEKRYFDRNLGITGQMDLIARMGINDDPMLIDYKTSYMEDRDKWPLQAALYYLILKTNGIQVRDVVVFLRLKKDGEFPAIHRYEMTKELLNVAISAVNLFKYLTRK